MGADCKLKGDSISGRKANDANREKMIKE